MWVKSRTVVGQCEFWTGRDCTGGTDSKSITKYFIWDKRSWSWICEIAWDGFIYAQKLVCLLCERTKTSVSRVNKSHLSNFYCAAQCNCILNNQIRSYINKQYNTKPLISPVLCEKKKSLKTAVSLHKEWWRRQDSRITNRGLFYVLSLNSWI